jgi:hypothetical protein
MGVAMILMRNLCNSDTCEPSKRCIAAGNGTQAGASAVNCSLLGVNPK